MVHNGGGQCVVTNKVRHFAIVVLQNKKYKYQMKKEQIAYELPLATGQSPQFSWYDTAL